MPCSRHVVKGDFLNTPSVAKGFDKDLFQDVEVGPREPIGVNAAPPVKTEPAGQIEDRHGEAPTKDQVQYSAEIEARLWHGGRPAWDVPRGDRNVGGVTRVPHAPYEVWTMGKVGVQGQNELSA